MPQFDAGTYVEAVGYNFTKYVPECEGDVPEPSKGALEKFQAKSQDIFKRSLKNAPKKDLSQLTQGEMLELMEKADAEEANRLNEELYEAVVEVCNGRPSREEIDQLPGRPQQAFCVYIVQAMNNPNYQSGAASAANGAASTTSSGGISGSGPKR